jgi:hypothetical protein
MNLIKLTPINASQYIGFEILFKTRGTHIVKKIISVTNVTVQIDHPDLNNNLQLLTRNIYVIIV